MLKTITLAAALAAFGAAGPATAGSWGVGFGFGYGPPVFWGPPPVYYGPPRHYYGEPPIVVAPPAPVYRMVGPDQVFDMLDASGYRELSPMARRGAVYKLRAVDPGGNLVALEISVFTGAIERVRLLQARYAAPPPAPAPALAEPRALKPPRQAVAAPKPAAPQTPAAAPSAAPIPNTAGAGSPAPLSQRLQPVPSEPEEPAGNGGDPLVVY